jgi:hypothetical protein
MRLAAAVELLRSGTCCASLRHEAAQSLGVAPGAALLAGHLQSEPHAPHVALG